MGWCWLTGLLLLRSFGIGLTGIGYCLVILYMGKWLLWANCCLFLGFYCVLNGIVLLCGLIGLKSLYFGLYGVLGIIAKGVRI